jgi:CelD/BcsL family acetyltransferase involved in cellulose biosynthesis
MSAEFALVESKDCAALFADEQSAESRAHVAANEIELAVYHELAAAEPVWRSLQKDGACTAFQTFEWLSMWQRHIGTRTGAMPCIVVARDANGAPLFIVPLAVCSSGFTRELTWLGSDLCDYNAPIFAKDALDRLDHAEFAVVWQNIVELLRREPRCRYDLARLEKMPPSIGTKRNPMLALQTSLNPSGSYVTPLFGTWDEFYKAKRSSSTRRRDRSKRNHLAEAGEVKLVTADDSTTALDTFSVLVEQKSKTFARHGIANLFARPAYLDFYRDLAGNPAMRDFVHISRLNVGDEVVATNLGLVFGGRYYHVLASYTDGDLSRWGPGAAHLNDLLAYAIEHKCEAFDFTIGDERYKRDWCDEVQPLHDHVAVATWRGALIAGPALVTHGLKRTVKQTPILWAAAVKFRALAARLRRAASTPASEGDTP